MPISSSDLKLRLSGGASNTSTGASIGGAKSSTDAVNVFDKVSGSENETGDTEYRVLYVENVSQVSTAGGVILDVSTDTSQSSRTISVAAGVGGKNSTAPVLASEQAVPSGVTFDSLVNLGDLGPGEFFPVFLKRDVMANAQDGTDSFTLRTRATVTADPVTPVEPDPTVPTGNGTTVKNMWTGEPKTDGVLVSARMNTTKSANTARLVVSESADLSNPVKGPIVAPDATYRIAKLSITGLAPRKNYFYGVEIEGTLDTALKGKFRTLPPVGTPTSLRIAVGCCSNHTAGSSTGWPAWQAVRDLSPDIFLHIGDLTYADSTSTDVANHIGKYESVLSTASGAATRHQTLREVNTSYIYDDHDFGDDDLTGRDSAGAPTVFRNASIEAYRLRVPVTPQSSVITDPVDHFHEMGRARIILSDLRADRWAVVSGNLSTRKMMGDAQKQRFKDHISAAKAAGQYVIWCSSSPFVGGSWGPYAVEQTELADHIKAVGMAGRVFVFSGDMHAMAYHSGYDVATGGGCPIPVFNIGAMHNTPTTKGGPYTFGPVSQTATSNLAYADITDNGGDTVAVHVVGKAAADNSILMEYNFTINLNGPAADTTAPVLTAANGSATGATTATVGVTTDTGEGTLYRLISNSSTATATQVKAGSSQAVTSAGAKSFNETGLSSATTYYAHFLHRDASGNDSAVLSSAGFQTQAVAAPTRLQATGGTYTEPAGADGEWEILADTDFVVTEGGWADVFPLGGAGSGGNGGTGCGGGGGAGGVLPELIRRIYIPAGTHRAIIGQGGVGVVGVLRGNNGGATSLGDLVTVPGGGAGGATTAGSTANSAGNGGGGGGGSGPYPGAAAAVAHGHKGGDGFGSGTSSERAGGGGGGIGGDGGNAALSKGGNGGVGAEVWGKRYGGGGPGAVGGSSATLGTYVDGAGAPGGLGAVPADAVAGTGAGGGGQRSNTLRSGNGASGVIRIRRAPAP